MRKTTRKTTLKKPSLIRISPLHLFVLFSFLLFKHRMVPFQNDYQLDKTFLKTIHTLEMLKSSLKINLSYIDSISL